MPSRRGLLRVGGTSVTTFLMVGCLGGPNDAGSQPTKSESTSTQTSEPSRTPEQTPTVTPSDTPTDPVMIRLANDRDTSVTVSAIVTSGSRTLLEVERELMGNSAVEVETGITSVGEYEARIELADGDTATATFSWNDYDIRTGSNIIVWIGDKIEIVKEV